MRLRQHACSMIAPPLASLNERSLRLLSLHNQQGFTQFILEVKLHCAYRLSEAEGRTITEQASTLASGKRAQRGSLDSYALLSQNSRRIKDTCSAKPERSLSKCEARTITEQASTLASGKRAQRGSLDA